MGQAKQRGTFEERKAQSEERIANEIRARREIAQRRGKSRLPYAVSVWAACKAIATTTR